MTTMEKILPTSIQSRLTGRRWRQTREALTAYLFLFPAVLIIGLFGLFPLLFSVFISVHQWRGNLGDYIGLTHYVRALGNLAYVTGILVTYMFLSMTAKTVFKVLRDARENEESPWVLILPALVTAFGVWQLLRFSVFLFYEVLTIPQRIRGMERTRELFLQMLGESWRHPEVSSARLMTVLVFLFSFGLVYAVIHYVTRSPRDLRYYGRFVAALVFLACGLALGWLTFNHVQSVYVTAQEAGQVLDIWQRVIATFIGLAALAVMNHLMTRIQLPGNARAALIFGGLILAGGLKLVVELGGMSVWVVLGMLLGAALLFLSWKVWDAAQEQESTLGLVLWFFAAIFMMIGAWVLLAELPMAIQDGYATWWQGLLVTVYYSLFTVPIQLALALFTAVLLFQDIKGKTFFRVIYFLPYITSPVAAAAVFRVIFSGRTTGPINHFLSIFGIRSLLWLDEPMGIFQMIAGPNVNLPSWMVGPSLALIVIVIFNIWNFFGYNAVVFLAGLGSIPKSLYEAASIDGGGRWAQFRHITLPLLSPTTYFLSLIAIIGTFKAFTHVWVLRSNAALGTTDTASIVIFNEFNRNTRYGYASAMALVLMGIVLVLTLVNNRIAEKKVFYG